MLSYLLEVRMRTFGSLVHKLVGLTVGGGHFLKSDVQGICEGSNHVQAY